jgi:hypothetical protein
VNSELRFFEGSEAGEYFGEYTSPREKFEIPKDKENPTILMKLQNYMDKNDCGTGYLFWLVPNFTPQYVCPKCGTGTLHVIGIDYGEEDDKIHYRCGNGHEWSGAMDERCRNYEKCSTARSRGYFDCRSCRYFHLILGRLFNEGRNIFKGTSANELLDGVASAITDQRKRRLQYGEVEDLIPQDDEEED